MIRLVATCNERTISFPLTEDLSEVTAGSLPENGIYLPYKGISRRHFSVIKNDQSWILQDLGSTNGTSLNGKNITKAPLHPGDLIQIGAVTIRVEATSEEVQQFDSPVGESTNTRKTDKYGEVPFRAEGIPYSFPNLVLPEDMIIGKSAVMMEIYRKLQSIVDSDLNILFVGETGTGKDFLARMVHLSSKRSGPFVTVNCAAIPSELVEAEMFGIGEKVATNVRQRKGKIAAAEGGTLLLDELSAFPYELQAKILRAIEDKMIHPVGETRAIPVDFRLISATNEDPKDLIQTGRLRQDLYHRLAAVEFYIPPLRERKEDLEVLIPAILKSIAQKENKRLAAMSKRLFALLLNYSYPGNLRELMNILKAIVAFAHSGEILDIHLVPEKLLGGKGGGEISDFVESRLQEGDLDLRNTVDEFTRNFVVRALRIHGGNVPRAAKQLKVTTFGLRKMMKRLGIPKEGL